MSRFFANGSEGRAWEALWCNRTEIDLAAHEAVGRMHHEQVDGLRERAEVAEARVGEAERERDFTLMCCEVAERERDEANKAWCEADEQNLIMAETVRKHWERVAQLEAALAELIDNLDYPYGMDYRETVRVARALLDKGNTDG